MSLARTALRLQTIEALYSHPVIAAQCAGRIYDSQIEDFDAQELAPTIVVTTERLQGDAFNAQNGGEPFDDHCDLVLEIAMTQLVQPEGDDPFLLRPPTDQKLEATLDNIAECASFILTLGRSDALSRPTPQGMLLQKAVVRRVPRRGVDRFATDDAGTKLAIHILTFQVQLKGEAVDARSPPSGDFAKLPDPLRTVAASLTAPSSIATCRMLVAQRAVIQRGAATLTQTSVAPPLDPTQQVPGTLPVTISFPVSEDP